MLKSSKIRHLFHLVKYLLLSTFFFLSNLCVSGVVGCCHTDFLLLRAGIRLSDCSRQLQSVQQQRIQVVDVESQTDLPHEFWRLMALPVQMKFTTSHPQSVFCKDVSVCPGIIFTSLATWCLLYLLFWGTFCTSSCFSHFIILALFYAHGHRHLVCL